MQNLLSAYPGDSVYVFKLALKLHGLADTQNRYRSINFL